MRHLLAPQDARPWPSRPRREPRGENEHAGAGDAFEQAATADIGDDDFILLGCDEKSCQVPLAAARTAEWMR